MLAAILFRRRQIAANNGLGEVVAGNVQLENSIGQVVCRSLVGVTAGRDRREGRRKVSRRNRGSRGRRGGRGGEEGKDERRNNGDRGGNQKRRGGGRKRRQTQRGATERDERGFRMSKKSARMVFRRVVGLKGNRREQEVARGGGKEPETTANAFERGSRVGIPGAMVGSAARRGNSLPKSVATDVVFPIISRKRMAFRTADPRDILVQAHGSSPTTDNGFES